MAKIRIWYEEIVTWNKYSVPPNEFRFDKNKVTLVVHGTHNSCKLLDKNGLQNKGQKLCIPVSELSSKERFKGHR